MVGVGFNQKFQMVVLLLFGTCNQYQYLQYVITCQMTCICYLKERVMFHNVYIIKKSSLVLDLLFFDSYKVCKIDDITAMKEYITKNNTKLLVTRNRTFANNGLSFLSMDFVFSDE